MESGKITITKSVEIVGILISILSTEGYEVHTNTKPNHEGEKVTIELEYKRGNKCQTKDITG